MYVHYRSPPSASYLTLAWQGVPQNARLVASKSMAGCEHRISRSKAPLDCGEGRLRGGGGPACVLELACFFYLQKEAGCKLALDGI